ncbi:hypothetical protein D3C71_1827410 [compost metagenome]
MIREIKVVAEGHHVTRANRETADDFVSLGEFPVCPSRCLAFHEARVTADARELLPERSLQAVGRVLLVVEIGVTPIVSD